MIPSAWGPECWKVIHSVAATSVTRQQRLDFVEFIEVLAKVLPCEACKQHFRENMRKNDVRQYLKNEKTLFMWTFIMHDAVNEALKRDGTRRPSFDEVYRQYFEVADDSSAVNGEAKQSTICRDVCNSAADGVFPDERKADESGEKSNSKSNSVNSSKRIVKLRR
jgi:hypothetical protein